MTTKNVMRDKALPFAVFTFLLVLIATFGVVYRDDLYPGYAFHGTLVQIGLYRSPNVSVTTDPTGAPAGKSASGKPVENPVSVAPSGKSKKDNAEKSDFSGDAFAVFTYVTSRPTDNTNQHRPKNPVERPPPHDFRETPKEILKNGPKPTSEKLSDDETPKATNTRSKFNSFHDRLFGLVSRDLADDQSRRNNLVQTITHDIQPPFPVPQRQNQISPKLQEIPVQFKFYSSMVSSMFKILEGFWGGSYESSGSFFDDDSNDVDYLDDSDEYDSEESDSDEFFFDANPGHFAPAEKLPEFIRPTIDFPLIWGFQR